MTKKMLGAAGALLIAVAIAGVLLIAGEDSAPATETDGAFLMEMNPHHEGAIAMAEIAQRRAQHPQVKRLADEIIEAQEAEIAQIDGIHERLFGEPAEGAEHGTLGLDSKSMGMEMNTEALLSAQPFDRAFIDMMIPHHQGAIQMARVQIASGQDPETIALARGIIAAQSTEIEAMNAWRARWYGEASPAGGVPADEDTSIPSHEQMGHG